MAKGSPRRAVAELTSLAVVVALTAVLSGSQTPSRPAPQDPCATGEPSARIAACTARLSRPNLERSESVAAYVNRGNAHDALGEFDLALKDFQAALDLDPDSWPALRARAVANHSHGHPDEAVKDLSHAFAHTPDDMSPLRFRGAAYADMGQMARAIEDFSKVLDREPSDLAIRQARGLALASVGEHGRAIQDFSRVINRNPRARVSRAGRAFSYFRTRQYALAISDWDRLLQDDPTQLDLVYCRGAAKVLSGEESGRSEMESVRQSRPDVATTEAAACPVPSAR
jgi:tetratricopeptide (TPR) repeat protein